MSMVCKNAQNGPSGGPESGSDSAVVSRGGSVKFLKFTPKLTPSLLQLYIGCGFGNVNLDVSHLNTGLSIYSPDSPRSQQLQRAPDGGPRHGPPTGQQLLRGGAAVFFRLRADSQNRQSQIY